MNFEKLVLRSIIVGSANTLGVCDNFTRISSIMLNNLSTPISEKELSSIGTITACDARSALKVKKPRLGGQSIMTA